MAKTRSRGPANLSGRMGKGLRVRGPAAKRSRAARPRFGNAGPPGAKIPNGAATGAGRGSSGLFKAARIRVTSDGRPSGKINLKPKADGPSRI